MSSDSLSESAPDAYGPTFKDQILRAANDVVLGFAEWRVWTMLALGEIRRRYRRSVIGQLWLTISMGVTIVAMGMLWGMIFHSGLRNTLPFIGVGMMVWGLLAGLIQETATAFVSAEGYLRQICVPKTAIVNQVILRNLIVFAHNAILVPVIYVFFPPEGSFGFLLIPIGLALYIANGLWLGLLLGTLCARFRDLSPIIASVMQVLFFLTPIVWNPDQVGPSAWYVVHLNPLASFVSILREPLLGVVPPAESYWMASCVTLIGFLVAIPFFARFRARIVYWL
jgi:ABC-type polysaccharide/polyol phosphate export permease